MKTYFTIACICLLYCIQASAQLVSWTGTSTGGDGVSWEDPLNWSTGMLPPASAKVFIANDSISITTAQPELERVELNNAILEVNNLLLFNNDDTFAIQLENGSKLINNDTIEIEEAGNNEFNDRGIEILSNSMFSNNGVCRISDMRGGYAVRLESNSLWENNGHLYIEGSGNLMYVESEFINNDSIIGILNVSVSYGIISAGQLTNNGFISLTMNDGNAALSCLSAGQIHNYGDIDLTLNDCNFGILVSGANCQFHHHDGTISYSNANNAGIWIRLNTLLSVYADAVLIDNGGGTGDFLDMEDGAELQCTGTMQLGN